MDIAFSSCPNDTYLFYGWVHGKINAPKIQPHYMDIEALNESLLQTRFPLCKGSIALWPLIKDDYTLLSVGSAVGYGCGPLLIRRAEEILQLSELKNGNLGINPKMRIAVPGRYTTAHLLLNHLYPFLENKVFCAYHEVEALVNSSEVEAGILIHETRFTYQNKGLSLVADLGAQWEALTGLPIPLGGIYLKRDEQLATTDEISVFLRASLAYAKAHEEELMPYILEHSQDLNAEVVKKHIDLYVTEETTNLSQKALQAIHFMTNIALIG